MNDKPSSDQQQFGRAVSVVLKGTNANELYRLFNRIALVSYKEAANAGYMVLCPRPLLAPVLTIETPMPLDNVRGVRKMLQITLPTLAALCDGQNVYGFGNASAAAADVLSIQFRWPGIWQLMKGGRTIMRTEVHNGARDAVGLREDSFYTALQQVFGPIVEAARKDLWDLVVPATRQARGTNVLISANAAAEATRLSSQCTRVRPFALTPAVMEQITSLDGSVVIDLNGVCHAMGAILDGGVSARGERARGGRYNSALMYVDSCPFPSLILVVSQDGMVDLVFRQRQP